MLKALLVALVAHVSTALPFESILETVASSGDARMPTVGTNMLTAGGGGACEYEYATHDATPVVTRATCTITESDLDKGTNPARRGPSPFDVSPGRASST
jgi:hypothetical protein